MLRGRTFRLRESCYLDTVAVVRSDPTPSMPAEVAEFVADHVGELVEASFCGWDHGVSDVWECRSIDGRRLFVKTGRDKFDQEVRAYRQWAPHLDGRCPELLAADEPLGVLAISAVDGRLAQNLEPDASDEVDMYRQAGEVLRSLHGLRVTEVGDDPVATFVERATRWGRRAVEHVGADDRAWVRERIDDIVPLLADTMRCPCHRDFTPRNWVVDEGGSLRLIDFGHAREDFWILDVDKLWSDQWVDRPEREAAFWDGYGRSPTASDWAVLEASSALGAVSTIVWSREHDDQAYEAFGRRHLARLRQRRKP